MQQAKQFMPDTIKSIDTSSDYERDPTLRNKNSNLVLLSTPQDGLAKEHGRGEASFLAEKWPGLVERVQGAARYIRDVEERAQEQELQVQELLKQVRADMDAARAQVLAAERETHDVHAQAIKLIQAAEDRAAAAEQRAAAAERMLERIANTIDTEFIMQPSTCAGGGQNLRGQAPASRAAS